jgi:hypothetical protein
LELCLLLGRYRHAANANDIAPVAVVAGMVGAGMRHRGSPANSGTTASAETSVNGSAYGSRSAQIGASMPSSLHQTSDGGSSSQIELREQSSNENNAINPFESVMSSTSRIG